MSYRIGGAACAILSAGLACLGLYCLFFPQDYVHFGGNQDAYEWSVRWMAGWFGFASLLAFLGFRYCRRRVESGPPDRRRILKFLRMLILLGVIVFLLCLFRVAGQTL